LLGKPHARLAAHRDLLKAGDTGEQYMERVRYLRKYDPEVWYISGILAITGGRETEAWEDWRKSLEYSDEYLADIAKRSSTILSTDELMDEVIPDNPSQLYHVAFDLYPKPGDSEERKPFLDRALEILAEPDRLKTWEDWRLKARILDAAHQLGLARTAYVTAIQFDPSQIDLRIEFATFLYRVGFQQEGKLELLSILSRDPSQSKANELLRYFEKNAPRK
jgi:tetratricopeptide (TPR) repeat protein